MTSITLTAPDDCKVFTPPHLAAVMAKLLPNRPNDRWIEPCVGRGAFLDALISAGVHAKQITAIELDRHEGLDDRCGVYHPGTDFLSWSSTTTERFDRIIGNPPFLPIYRMPKVVRDAALKVARPGGKPMLQRANCWYAFLSACLRLLKVGGGMCFVLPSAWEYADYAADMRELLPAMFELFEVHRSEASLFKGVLDGCVVLVADGYGRSNRVSNYRCFRSPESLISALDKPLKSAPKQTRSKVRWPKESSLGSMVRFREIARIRIGTVTGNAGYFLLSDDQREKLGIPVEDVLPVVTRARHLRWPNIDRPRWRQLLKEGERVWMFWPRNRAGRRSKAVSDYISAGEALKVDQSYKARAREPWFRPRLVPRADGFMSGMTPFGPWMCLNHMPTLSATNTLYTVHFHKSASQDEKAAWAISLVSAMTAVQHRERGRRYSDGLLKFEPRDVMTLQLRVPAESRIRGAATVYDRVIGLLLDGQVNRARTQAEGWLESSELPSNEILPLRPAKRKKRR